MNIPRINAYVSNIKKYQKVKSLSFGNTSSEPIKDRNNSLCIRGVPYETVMTYKEIKALKDFADNCAMNKIRPNVAIVFTRDCVGDTIEIKTQDDFGAKKGD